MIQRPQSEVPLFQRPRSEGWSFQCPWSEERSEGRSPQRPRSKGRSLQCPQSEVCRCFSVRGLRSCLRGAHLSVRGLRGGCDQSPRDVLLVWRTPLCSIQEQLSFWGPRWGSRSVRWTLACGWTGRCRAEWSGH